MSEHEQPDAWVRMPSEEEARSRLPADLKTPYNFEFLPNMTRLLMAHERIGKTFRRHYSQVMFHHGFLERREQELVAAVAAAAQDCHY